METTTNNDVDWEILYGSLVRDLGLDPQTFQLLYPFTSWKWPTVSLGYTSSAQHDFCSTMPQWSATGAFHSSGTRYDDAYGMFLSILRAFTTDPVLQQEILLQQQKVQEAKNAYDLVWKKADEAYRAATGGSNEPTFTAWLGTSEGLPWAEQLDTAWAAYQKEYVALQALVDQSQTPGLKEALAAYENRQYYLRYQDPHLSEFPQVPGYEAAKTPAQWLAEIEAGQGTPGTVVLKGIEATRAAESFRDTGDVYARTWAGGSLPVPYPFFASDLEHRGSSAVQPAASLSELTEEGAEMILHLAAWETIPISLEPWYRGQFVCTRRNGPFIDGFSGEPNDGDVYLWGDGGAMNLRKTSLLVAYEPKFEILGAEGSAAARALVDASVEAGLRVGPFLGTVGAGVHAGSRPESAAVSIPMIFGVDVEILPCE